MAGTRPQLMATKSLRHKHSPGAQPRHLFRFLLVAIPRHLMQQLSLYFFLLFFFLSLLENVLERSDNLKVALCTSKPTLNAIRPQLTSFTF